MNEIEIYKISFQTKQGWVINTFNEIFMGEGKI